MKIKFYLLSLVLAQHLVLDGDCIDDTITNFKALFSMREQLIDERSRGLRSLRGAIYLDENLFWSGTNSNFTKFHQEMQAQQISEKIPCYDDQICTIVTEWDGKEWQTTFNSSWNLASSPFMYASRSRFTPIGDPPTKFSFTLLGTTYATVMANKVSIADGHAKKRYWGFFGTLFGYNLHYRKQNVLLPEVNIPDVLFSIKYEILPNGQSPT